MTIQLLQTWAGKPAGIYTLDPGEESRLIGLGLARAYVLAMDGTAGDGAGEAVIAATTLPIAAAAGAPVMAGMLLRDPATGLIYGQSDGAGGYVPLGGSGSITFSSSPLSASAVVKGVAGDPGNFIGLLCTSVSGGKVTVRDGGSVAGALIPGLGGGGASGLALTAGQYVSLGAAVYCANGIFLEISGTGTYVVLYQ